ncbi:MAG TPA: hypothetical protein VNZ52_04865 [Candidatus Thermoplasmatota archaeon]|nr:hypothetical protein [Candidatus Thermoplasmatota archaeon]
MTDATCEFCGKPLPGDEEEPENLRFIEHLNQSPECAEILGFVSDNRVDEDRQRAGQKPEAEY